MLNPQYGLFIPKRGDLLVPNPSAEHYVGPNCREMYYVLGCIFARAIYEKIQISSQFSELFTRNLVGVRNGMNQLAVFDEEIYLQLSKIKNMGNVEQVTDVLAAMPQLYNH